MPAMEETCPHIDSLAYLCPISYPTDIRRINNNNSNMQEWNKHLVIWMLFHSSYLHSCGTVVFQLVNWWILWQVELWACDWRAWFSKIRQKERWWGQREKEVVWGMETNELWLPSQNCTYEISENHSLYINESLIDLIDLVHLIPSTFIPLFSIAQ